MFDLPFFSSIPSFRGCWRLEKKKSPNQTSNCFWATWNPDYGNVNCGSQHTFVFCLLRNPAGGLCVGIFKKGIFQNWLGWLCKTNTFTAKMDGFGVQSSADVYFMDKYTVEVFSKGAASLNLILQQNKPAEKGGWRALRGNRWIFLIWERGMVPFLSFFCAWKSCF